MSYYVRHVATFECEGCGNKVEIWYDGSPRPPLPPMWKRVRSKVGDDSEVCSDMCELRVKTGNFAPNSPHGG